MAESDGLRAADRQLDLLVAEKVFGWRRGTHVRGTGAFWCRPGMFEEFRNVVPADESLPLSRHADHYVPHYSRDWAGAGLVVERMRSLGWKVILETVLADWRVMFFRPGLGVVFHDAPGVGEAISRAALAALATLAPEAP